MTIGKPQIIEAIREINPTAKRPWLEKFTEGDLDLYLDHLQLTQEPRGTRSTWIRAHATPATTGSLRPGPETRRRLRQSAAVDSIGRVAAKASVRPAARRAAK